MYLNKKIPKLDNFQGLIQKEKVHISCKKGAQSKILANNNNVT